jgi:hypothetical protein
VDQGEPDVNEFVSLAVQILVALIVSGTAFKLLTIRQERRKIGGEATAQEANAASVLTGASLQMVENAQRDAKDAKREAKACKDSNENLWDALNRARWKIHYLEEREASLEAALRAAGIEVPVREEHDHPIPSYPPPDDGIETKEAPGGDSQGASSGPMSG